MRRAWAIAAFAAAVAVGCAGQEGKAEDKTPKPAEPRPVGKDGGDKDGGSKDGGKDAKPVRRWQARVTDRMRTPPVLFTDVVLYAPEVSLFGGASGETQKHLIVKKGGHEITVPFDEIASIELPREEADDKIEVVIKFRDPARAGKELKGQVRSNLELRGYYEGGTLRATIKLRDTKLIEVEEMPANAPPAPKGEHEK